MALAMAWIVPQYAFLLLRDRFPALAASNATWERVHARAAATIHALGVHLAGLFVKVCQIIGARSDVFPRPFIEKLSRFHDRAPSRPFDRLRPLIEAELGRPVEDVFDHVEPEPLAAASLAQVHRARLRDGRIVALKVQYPEIRRIAPVDIASLRRVARVVALLQKRLDLRSIVEEIAKFVALELDFRREAESTLRVAGKFGESADVRVPALESDLCADRILVLEFLDGIQVTDVDRLRRADHDLVQVAQRIGRIYAEMLFEHGFFHGDPHPGNLLVLADGRIGLLDYGLAKELPPGFADGVARMLGCALGGDAPGALAAAAGLGFDVQSATPESVTALVKVLLGERMEGKNVLDVVADSPVTRVPPDFGLVFRTLILLNGVSHSLAPGQRIVQAEMAKALFARAARGAAGSPTTSATDPEGRR